MTAQNVTYTLTMSKPLNERLERLVAACGGTDSEVLTKALALYELAVTAQAKNLSVAILDKASRIHTVIEGI